MSMMIHQRGLALPELLVAIFLLATATIAITGLAVIGSRTSVEGERQTVGLAIANDEMEKMRLLAYDNIGYTATYGGEAAGTLQRTEEVTQNSQSYTVERKIELVDDPVNGVLPQGTLNETTADYKKVTVIVHWKTANGSTRDVTATSFFSQGQTARCVPGEFTCPGAIGSAETANACVRSVECPSNGICPDPYGGNGGPYCPPGAAFCPQCYTNNDCDAGFVCSADQVCVSQPGSCRTSGDCSGGQVCDDGQCTAACTSSSDCSSGEVCDTSTGICINSCTGLSCSCAGDYVCNVSTETCEPPPPPPSPDPSHPPSINPSPSVSPSTTPSTSPSGSATPSGTPSSTPTVSPSPSPSPTPSGSSFPSTSPTTSGTPAVSPSTSASSTPSPAECADGYVDVNGQCVVDCRSVPEVCGGDSCDPGTGSCGCTGSGCDDPNWCENPEGVIDCSLLDPYDPGCPDPDACISSGRIIITGWYNAPIPNDPMCVGGATGPCLPETTFAPCASGSCGPTSLPSPSQPPDDCQYDSDCGPCERCNDGGAYHYCSYYCAEGKSCDTATNICVDPTATPTPPATPTPSPSPSATNTATPTPEVTLEPPSPSATQTFTPPPPTPSPIPTSS